MSHKLYYEEGWFDIVSPFSSAQGTGTTEPNWQDIGNGMYAYRFTDGEELFVNFHINHNIKIPSKIYPHIHWMPSTNMVLGETLTWEITFSAGRGHHQGDILTGTTTTLTIVYTSDGTELAGEHMVLECTDAQAVDAMEPDSVGIMRCKYLTGTYTDPVYGLMADLHCETDRNTTPQKSPDFYVYD